MRSQVAPAMSGVMPSGQAGPLMPQRMYLVNDSTAFGAPFNQRSKS